MGRGVLDKIEDAKYHGLLHISQCNLIRCPNLVFTSVEIKTTLWRLDLSYNLIETLPDAIGTLTALQILWINENPRLNHLPSALANCSQLQVLDVSATALHSLPSKLAKLQRLKVLDVSDTPLQQRWIIKKHLTPLASGNNAVLEEDISGIQSHMCAQIFSKLRRKDERTRLKYQLFEKLHDDVYRVEKTDQQGANTLRSTIQRLMKQFPLADEIRSVIRNAEQFFPSVYSTKNLLAIDTTNFRQAFDRLRTENDMKKRAADLELKIRNLYFDRIDPTTVEGMVKGIYDHVRELSDIKFLIKYATQLFPKEAKEVDGKEIQQRIKALQDDLTRERAAAIDKLLAAAKAIYNDTEPDRVKSLITRVAMLFKVSRLCHVLTN